MKNKNVVTELNALLDSFARKQQKRQEVLKDYLMKFKSEERKLQKKLDNESNDELCSKLNKKLDLIKTGYDLLKSNQGPDQAQ